MRRALATIAFLSAIAVIATPVRAVTINGAGATFPYPLYSQWAYKYNQLTGMQLNYQSIGSGGGIQQIKAGTVDFGASDAPLKSGELKQAGLVQFPMVIGGVVPVVNVKGIKPGQIKIDGKTLADIFLGKIKRWDAPAIKSLNPKVKLPGVAITVVHRADGSGTSWIFTNYLSKVSTEWSKTVGAAKAVSWPTGVGGKGNEGVAAYVQRVNGAIGYVEYAYALQNKMTYVALRNKAGAFVKPNTASFSAAAENADWKKSAGYYVVLTNQPGKGTWPITGASFILVHKDQRDKTKAVAMLRFFYWCFRHGSDMAVKLNYVPIPKNVYELVEKTWKSDVKAGGKPVQW